jgi:hypothetical protein
MMPWPNFERVFNDWARNLTKMLNLEPLGECAVLQKEYAGELAANAGYRADALNPALGPELKRMFLDIASDELNDHARREKVAMQARGCL